MGFRPRLALVSLLVAAGLCPAAAQPRFSGERLYVLNTSDFLYQQFRDDIAYSKRFRGRYQARFPFRELKFAEYFLKKGETIHTLAVRLGVSVDAIATASGVAFFYGPKEGTRLVAPNCDGVVYYSEQGCTLQYLSERYGVPVADIQRANRFYEPVLKKGDWVLVPGASMPAMEQALFYGSAFASPLPAGALSSGFGFRRDPLSGQYAFHGGLDLAAAHGTPVLAAHDGDVEFAGWAGGYGRLVVIRHAYGYRSYYGHLSALAVRAGQRIGVGKRVGAVGSTGYSTGPHLHFEIRHYERPLDPARYASLHHRPLVAVQF